MDIKEKITELLLSTGRENIGNVLEYMESHGFFTAPASVSNHNNNEGGLAEHSLDAYEEAIRLNSQLPRPHRKLLHGLPPRLRLHPQQRRPVRHRQPPRRWHHRLPIHPQITDARHRRASVLLLSTLSTSSTGGQIVFTMIVAFLLCENWVRDVDLSLHQENRNRYTMTKWQKRVTGTGFDFEPAKVIADNHKQIKIKIL